MQSTNYLLIAIMEVNPSAWKNSISELHLSSRLFKHNFWAVCVWGGGLLSVVAIKPGVPEISEYLWIF